MRRVVFQDRVDSFLKWVCWYSPFIISIMFGILFVILPNVVFAEGSDGSSLNNVNVSLDPKSFWY